MRQMLFIGILILSFNNVNAQDEILNQLDSDDDVYEQLLRTYCQNVFRVEATTDVIFVEHNYITTDNLPEHVDNVPISILNDKKLKKVLRKRRTTRIVRIVPLRIVDNTLFSTIIEFQASYKKKAFHYVNKGGFKFEVRFDCDKRNFKISMPASEQ